MWIINPASAATLASTAKDSGSGLNGQMAGKRVIESAHCPSATAFFGVFRHLYIGMFGGMDLVIDPYSSARNGVIEITASQLTDVAVAHAGAFNKVTLTP
ncbi:MAG: phage major capsid protein [Alphaproteobacteria bacterium]|nr:phage major capsid protein [Alphaproteobacteria bacterium]